MMWFICMIAAVACGILNPHIGLFSIFSWVQVLIMFCFVIVGKSRFRIAKVCDANGDFPRGQLLRKSGGTLLTAVCIVSVILCLISSVVNVIVWMLSSGRLNGVVSSVPFDIIGVKDDASACMLLAVLSVAFNVMGTLLVILRQRQIRQGDEQSLMPDQVGVAAITGLRPGILTILGILAAMVLGFLNPYFTWLTFLHMFYLLFIFVTVVILQSYRRMASKNGQTGYMARYLLLQMTAGYS